MLSTWRREDNYEEYLRLLQNEDYLDVTYDEKSGGVSAVHRLHKFAKMLGPYGVRHGEYERIALDVLRMNGYLAILEAENNIPGIKTFDGYLDDAPMEIKAVEGIGTWAICTKMLIADKQHAQCLVLYFPEERIYSPYRVKEGLRLFNSNPDINSKESRLLKLIVIVGDRIVSIWNKKTTPIKEWSI